MNSASALSDLRGWGLYPLFSLYLTLNLLVVVGFFTVWGTRLWARGIFSRQELRLHYLILIFCFVAAGLQVGIPRPRGFEPVVKIWSAPTLADYDRAQSHTTSVHANIFKAPVFPHTSDYVLWFVFGAVGGSLLVSAGILLSDVLRLRRIQHEAFALRRIGRVRIYISERVAIPFSYRCGRFAWVVLPMDLLARPADLKICIQHELQHHRQRDTLWAYLVYALRALCVLNPCVHIWSSWISEAQEFACDEAMVDRKKVQPQVYARCLVEVAQSALKTNTHPVCATGLMLGRERHLLKRRIMNMFARKTTPSRWLAPAVAASASIMLAVTAYAGKGLLQDRRITHEQALEMAKVAQKESEFPVVVNADVVTQLNRFLGTPEGRQFLRDSLRRMREYQAMVESKLGEYRAPMELMAIPLVESGYLNHGPKENPVRAAGLWQFIASTARHFGLRVNNEIDQRLDVELSTDAAIRYLLINKLRFQDWQLSLLAYNIGESRVQEFILKTGSRDAWALIRAGAEGDKDYLAKVMAAILILKNPDAVG
ncbi:MAG: transglycosylase SLT domain-containing protein [Bdellovibrionales bacterium]